MTPAGRAARPHVVIVGAGFGGLNCARALGGADLSVTVIDRRNYHLFVPLLYQVATAALSPADIAQPIRKILARHQNIDVVLGEVSGVDPDARTVGLRGGRVVGYDRLVLAAGSAYSYFGHDEWASLAPGPRTLEDAREIRARLLMSFELAEMSNDAEERAALLTTVVVGGGPTGVEMAGAIAELARYTLAREFRRIDPAAARILLVEAGPRVLSGFPPNISDYARRALERLGVTVMTDAAVEDVAPGSVTISGRKTAAGTVIWGAGIQASPAAGWLGVEGDRIGRIHVNDDLSVPGFNGVYALGDTAALEEDGHPLPALAQVASQQGWRLGQALKANLLAREPMPGFRFRNRGNTAIVGRSAAVFDFGRWRLRGFLGWILWAVVHVYLLTGFEKRLLVSMQWLWRYLTYERGARLIMGPVVVSPAKTGRGDDRDGEAVPPPKDRD